MKKEKMIKELGKLVLADNGWAISENKGSGYCTDLSGGDLTIIAPDGTVANICLIVRDRKEKGR